MPAYDKFTKERSTLERRTLVSPMEKGQETLNALHADGWRTVRSGPYTNKRMFPKVDINRFLFVAEREVEVAVTSSTPAESSRPQG
jgi:hypothetical protein